MDSSPFFISKSKVEVAIWIHPEGRVLGSIYLQDQSDQRDGAETPWEVLDKPLPFLVVECRGADSPRFYNKRSIVRLEYEDNPDQDESGQVAIPCRLSLMDGSLVDGTIREFLAPSHARLYDYLNLQQHRFIEMHLDSGRVCLVNKAYIVRATPI